ncbi:MAG: J domain-containing protein, partial [Acidobacteria bacterium]|nr:J domain-containing protein [Acidobacteriota bacterium]
SLPETATVMQIKDAYLDYALKYFPEKFSSKEVEDLQEKATELFLAGARAYAILSDGELKENLKRQRIEKRQKAFSTPPPSQKDLYKELLDAKT